MTSYIPAKKAAAFTTWICLTSRSTGQFQANPTLAAGDVKISKDGGALANVATLPTIEPAGSIWVKLVLDTTETNADNLNVQFIDAAGNEWNDVAINIPTVVRQVDDLAFPNTSGRGMDVDASGGVEVGSFQAGAITAAAIATGAVDADALAQDAAQEIADEILNRDIAGGASGGARNVRSALRAIRNRRAISGGTLTVYQENDTTSAWTAVITTTAGNPVSEVDPS